MSFCLHRNKSFPLTSPGSTTPHVSCLDCGREFEYDWEAMKVGAEIKAEKVEKVTA